MAFLKLLKGRGLTDQIDLDAARCLMGRHPSCHVVVDANSVSRQHAQIVWDEGQYLIEDLKSRNGTFLNDRQVIGKQRLGDGDRIKICDFEFVFSRGAGLEPGGLKQDSVSAVPIEASNGLIEDRETNELAKITARLDLTQTGFANLPSTSAEIRLKTLIEITQALSRTLVLDDVLPNVLESLFKIFVQAERGFIFLLDEHDQLQARWFLTRNPNDRKDHLRVSRTVIDHVLGSQEAILSVDAANDQRFDLSKSIAAQNVRSIMCAPIIDADGKSIGCIQIDTFSLRARFKDDDLEVLASVGMQAGVAIENARLMEDAIERREVQRDLELAHEVQAGILPREKPILSSYDFFDYYQPAHQIGGDYFDYIKLRDGRIAILVADVVGHGIPAALLMAKFSSETRFALANHSTVKVAVEALNQTFCALSFERFVTMVVAVIDPIENRFSFVNAGHNPPLIKSANGVRELPRESSGLPIGIDASIQYQVQEVEFDVGDALVMFTDGITEAFDPTETEYGNARMEEVVDKGNSESASQLGNAIVNDLNQFTSGRSFNDDVCLVCVSRVASPIEV